MINLLPPAGKKQIVQLYWLRVAVVYFFLVTAVALITVALILPTYFFVGFQTHSLSSYISESGIAPDALQEIEDAIAEANTLGALLIDTPTFVTTAEIITVIEDIARDQVSITSVTVERDEIGKVTNIEVTGTAPSRAMLVEYRDAITAHAYFAEVNLPISNLAKDQNVPFLLELTPSTYLETTL